MKKFGIPQMTLIQMVSDNVICTSTECTSVCSECACTGFGSCDVGYICHDAFSCPSGFNCTGGYSA